MIGEIRPLVKFVINSSLWFSLALFHRLRSFVLSNYEIIPTGGYFARTYTRSGTDQVLNLGSRYDKL